jgi:hypothetical protein
MVHHLPGCDSRTKKRDRFVPRSLADMRSATGPGPTWLWEGYLRPGGITLLAGSWKVGKRTLLMVLLSRLGTGGSFLGQALKSGTAVVVSEARERRWLDRAARLDFGPGIRWLSRPFHGKPAPADRETLIDYLVSGHGRGECNLVVIDPLPWFLADGENDTAAILDALRPWQRLAARGAAVLALYDSRKGDFAFCRSARDEDALTGPADIIIEMTWCGRPYQKDRRRRLVACSPHAATPRHRVIELDFAGVDYVSRGNHVPDDFQENWHVLSNVLEEAHAKLSRAELLGAWPESRARPHAGTLWRWLQRATREGRILRDGLGRKSEPFRYWLTGREPAVERV